MEGTSGHHCVGCNIAIPLKDGHNKCVLCLGHQHATWARDTPQSCMNCFIMPIHTREARCLFFTSKREGLSFLEGPVRNMGRVSRRPGECSRATQASLFSLSVPRAPVSLCVGPSPPPSLFSDREYDGSEEEDLDVETVFSLESGQFSSEQPPTAKPPGRELAHLFGEIVGRAAKALNIVLPEKPTAAASRFEA